MGFLLKKIVGFKIYFNNNGKFLHEALFLIEPTVFSCLIDLS